MFDGYLIKNPVTNVVFPEKYIVWGSYSTTPDRRQDLDSFRDLSGVLHRNVVSARPSTLKFETRAGLHLAEKQEIQTFFNGCMVNEAEKKVRITFWDDMTNDYKTENMYLPDIEFPIMYHTSNDITYESVSFELIGYGD